jgi:hypothetical protein
VHVEDSGDVSTVEPPIFPGLRSMPPTVVEVVVRIRLAVTRKRRVRILLMQAQSVFEQGDLGSERSRLGRHAHRRTENSTLSIMPGMMPARTRQGK